MRSFPSSLHLLAYRLGAWEVRPRGTQTGMSGAWISSYLFNFVPKVPPELEFHASQASQELSEETPQETQQGGKRAREDDKGSSDEETFQY